MKRVIFDTNVYGRLILEDDVIRVSRTILDNPGFIVYGFRPIRKELRNTPKQSFQGSFKTRNLLLNLYDELTKGRVFMESVQIEDLARNIYNQYRRFGGIRGWRNTNISVDFTIVACAILNRLDVMISDDMSTMLSRPALRAYREVAEDLGLSLPVFWKYSDLKKKYGF
ncbi:MAG: hypothetical protein ABIA62_07520 [Candidatus Woesearchaeota archaeon]